MRIRPKIKIRAFDAGHGTMHRYNLETEDGLRKALKRAAVNGAEIINDPQSVRPRGATIIQGQINEHDFMAVLLLDRETNQPVSMQARLTAPHQQAAVQTLSHFFGQSPFMCFRDPDEPQTIVYEWTVSPDRAKIRNRAISQNPRLNIEHGFIG
ncbi:hypothetical protein ACFL31_05095 [Candidatus Margulisiibacteriota bacterium]